MNLINGLFEPGVSLGATSLYLVVQEYSRVFSHLNLVRPYFMSHEWDITGYVYLLVCLWILITIVELHRTCIRFIYLSTTFEYLFQKLYDEVNIHRHLYVALNVFMAINIISEDKWQRLPRTSLNDTEELKVSLHSFWLSKCTGWKMSRVVLVDLEHFLSKIIIYL